MDSLIQITKNTINGAEINSVNAREIYDYLGLAKGQFSRWIKTAIEKYDFIQKNRQNRYYGHFSRILSVLRILSTNEYPVCLRVSGGH